MEGEEEEEPQEEGGEKDAPRWSCSRPSRQESEKFGASATKAWWKPLPSSSPASPLRSAPRASVGIDPFCERRSGLPSPQN